MKTLEEKRIYQREYMRKYNQTEKGREYNRKHVKEHRKNNPGVSHGRRSKSTVAIYREAIIYYLLERDGDTCGFCGEKLDISNCHIDHIIPDAEGGEHRLENLRLSHPNCNISDGINVRKRVRGY